VVAACQDQADIVKSRADVILFFNDWLRPLVEIQRKMIVSRNKLGITKIEPTDKASSHGGTPALLILNELVHVSKWEAMESHFNNAAGVPRGMMIVSTNAGYKGTKAEIWKKNALKKKSRWHVHVWDKMAPWLDKEDVADSKEINTKSEFVRLFGRKGGGDNWASGKGDAFSEDSIDRVFRDGLEPMKGWIEGWDFLAGLDLGVSHDHSGLVVVGVNREEKRLRVANMWDWVPTIPNDKGRKEIDISVVRRACKYVYEKYRLVWFGYDPAAGGHIISQDMKKQGVRMTEVRFDGASLNEMAISLMQVMEAGVLESYENASLRRDLGKFEIVKRALSGYKWKAISDVYGHADVGTALAITLPKAIILMGGLPSEQTGPLMTVSGKDDEEEEITDPFLLDILGEGTEYDQDLELPPLGRKYDPFKDLF
jgi:hypothetical protein